MNKTQRKRIMKACRGRSIQHMQGVKERKQEERNNKIYVSFVRGDNTSVIL